MRLSFEPAAVSLSVADDGRGFAKPANLAELERGGGMGVMGMRERAAEIGASLDVDTTPGRGTTVRVTLRPRFRSGWTARFDAHSSAADSSAALRMCQ